LKGAQVEKFSPAIGQTYSYDELRAHYGKDKSYAFIKNRQLTAFALNPDMNPTAKNSQSHEVLKILVAKGKGRQGNLNRVLLNRPYPVFIKKETNHWEYVGLYNYCGFTNNLNEIANDMVGLVRQLDDIVSLIYLKKIEVSSAAESVEQKKAA
jgi:hypothetical protein